jgi:hypothetical protein
LAIHGFVQALTFRGGSEHLPSLISVVPLISEHSIAGDYIFLNSGCQNKSQPIEKTLFFGYKTLVKL